MILIKRGFFVVLSISLFLICSGKVLADVSAPTNLSTGITLFRVINLSWTAPEGATGYVVYVNGTAKATTTTASYPYPYVVMPGYPYCFTVVSFNANNEYSAPSSETCAPIVRGTAIAVKDLAARVVSSNNIELTWNYPLTQEERDTLDPLGYGFRFFVERSTDAGVTWSIAGTSYLTVDSESPQILSAKFNDMNPKSGMNNMYRVTALDEQNKGFSAISETASVNLGQVESVPRAPSNLQADYSVVSDPREVPVIWNDNSDDETGFVIEKKVEDAWVEMNRSSYPNNTRYELHLSYNTNYSIRVRAINAAGLSEPSNVLEIIVPSALSWTQPSVSQHLLIIYNADDPRSVDMKNYYMANRPGVSDANVFGVHFPAIGLDPKGFIIQYVDKALFQDSILKPITKWLVDHSDKPIRYIALMYGMPSIVSGCTTADYERCHSAQYQIGRALQIAGVRDGAEYRGGRTTRYTPEYYRGTTALVTTLDMGSVAATKGYIDKLKKVYEKMANKDVVISAKNAGLGGTTYYFEDKGDSLNIGEIARDAILSVNPSARVMYKPRGNFNTASDVLGYSTHGTWGGLAKNFPTNGSVIFSGNSGWYLLRTGESWNGIYNNVNSGQSNPSEWFAQTAFGSTNYENTPVGAVGQVIEPSGAGLASKELFTSWEKGYLFAEAAWSSRNMKGFLAVGDPLVANTGPVPATADITPADTVPPVIQNGAPSGTLPADTTSKVLSVTTNENATCKYSTTANTTFGASGSLAFSTTGSTNHSVTLSGLTNGISYRYYIRCRDSLSNTNTSDYPILFSIANNVNTQESDTTKPSVSINYPLSTSVVYEGQVTISASASDIVGIYGVRFYLDDEAINPEDMTYPYTAIATLSAGTHKVYAIAKDTSSNTAVSPTVTFVVKKPIVSVNTNNTIVQTTITDTDTDTDVVEDRQLPSGEMVYVPSPDSKIVDGKIVEDESTTTENVGIFSNIGSFFSNVLSSIKNFFTRLFD